MSATKSKKGKMQTKQKSNAIVSVPTQAVSYRGPAKLPQARGSDESYEVTEVRFGGTLSTSGSGVLAAVLDGYSQASSSTDWASLVNLYQEYRILSMHVECAPWNKYNQPTTTALAPVYTVTDRSGATPLSSQSATAAYASAEIHDPSTRIVRTIKMDGSDEASWIATSSTPANASRLYIKFYSAGNANSISLYDYLTTMIVQFRGRS